MRILIATDAWAPQVNGVVFTLQHTRRQLELLGHQVQVLHPGLFRAIPMPGYPEIRLSLNAGRHIPGYVQRFAPQAVHIATEGPLGMAMRRYALRHGLPFTTAFHTRFPEYLHARTRIPTALCYSYLRRFHRQAVHTMVPTPSVRNDLLTQGFDPKKVVIWSRGVDLQVFHPGESQAAASLLAPQRPAHIELRNAHDVPATDFKLDGPWARSAELIGADAQALPAKKPVFMYAGRVSVEKNLEAFLSLELPGVKWVVGDGPDLDMLQQRYPNVRFFGAMSHAELAHRYRMASVFVFPSLTDTFGLVLLEAMACGCPVAALPSSATRDVLANSGAGVIDADLHTACLQALRIPRQIPAQYAAGFSWADTTQKFLQYLQPIEEGVSVA